MDESNVIKVNAIADKINKNETKESFFDKRKYNELTKEERKVAKTFGIFLYLPVGLVIGIILGILA